LTNVVTGFSLTEEAGVEYVSTAVVSVLRYAEKNGGFTMIFKAIAFSPIISGAIWALGKATFYFCRK
jgi:hypothetical protein